MTTQSDGKTAFANSNSNVTADGAADGGSAPDTADTPAFISKVNGTSRQEQDPTINNDYVGSAAPTGGSVTFTVTGPSGNTTACVIPVVFNDANNGNSLTVPATNPALPSEDFGTGGATTFTPNGAGVGGFNVQVQENDDSLNNFVGCTVTNTGSGDIVDSNDCATYSYDEKDDVFQINGAAEPLSEFETALSPGDDVGGTYSPTPTGKSTFNLYADQAPEAPTPLPAAPNDDTATKVTVRFFESSRDTVAQYRLYRITKPSSGCPSTFTNTTYALVATVDDENPTSQPSAPLSADDLTVVAGTTYCYRLVSVDQGDEGPPTSASSTPPAPRRPRPPRHPVTRSRRSASSATRPMRR